MNDSHLNADRIDELLIDHTLFELTNEEQAELMRLLDASIADSESFERVAAVASLALLPHATSTLPDELKRRIMFSHARSISDGSLKESLLIERDELPLAVAFDREPIDRPVLRRREVLAWFVAAASLASVTIGQWRSPQAIAPTLSVAAARWKLLKKERDVIWAVCKPANDATSGPGLTGDIVWCMPLQKGFLHVRGLQKNVPERFQYQIWIFDENQDERYPIDGGVFDVEVGDAETVVAINAKLRVVNPTMFVVTIERAGGVVVSNRERLVLIAKPDAKPDPPV